MKYYILYKGENRGPLELAEMEEFDLNPKSRVWAPGWASWKDAEEVDEIMDYFNRREAQAREEQEARERAEQEAKARKEQEARAAREQAKAQQAQAQAQEQPAGQTGEETAQADGPEWYYAINNRQYGPVSEAELRNMGIGPDTLVWSESVGNSWIAASQVPALADIFVRTAPEVKPPVTMSMAVASGNTNAGASKTYSGQNDLMTGSAYLFGIVGAVCTVITIIVCIVQGEYYDSKELLAILAVCALPSFILSAFSLSAAGKCVNSCKLGDDTNAYKQHGLSMGLGIGAIISAIAGGILAFNDFAVV